METIVATYSTPGQNPTAQANATTPGGSNYRSLLQVAGTTGLMVEKEGTSSTYSVKILDANATPLEIEPQEQFSSSLTYSLYGTPDNKFVAITDNGHPSEVNILNISTGANEVVPLPTNNDPMTDSATLVGSANDKFYLTGYWPTEVWTVDPIEGTAVFHDYEQVLKKQFGSNEELRCSTTVLQDTLFLVRASNSTQLCNSSEGDLYAEPPAIVYRFDEASNLFVPLASYLDYVPALLAKHDNLVLLQPLTTSSDSATAQTNDSSNTVYVLNVSTTRTMPLVMDGAPYGFAPDGKYVLFGQNVYNAGNLALPQPISGLIEAENIATGQKLTFSVGSSVESVFDYPPPSTAEGSLGSYLGTVLYPFRGL